MNKLTLSLVIILITSFSAHCAAAVWQETNQWDENWEREYQHWIQKNLRRDIFTQRGTILYRLPTDCADALYAIRFLFAYQNKLPFVIHDIESKGDGPNLITNQSNQFDHIENEDERARAFLEFILTHKVSTVALVDDTFPVSYELINAGDIYLVEWSFFGFSRHPYRHSYILKGFDANRDIIYYYSDEPKIVRLLDVNVKLPKFDFFGPPFGFRRWRQPKHYGLKESEIPLIDGYSLNQYALLKKVGPRKILKEINRRRKNFPI